MRVVLHAEADIELAEGAAFIERERAGYGARFIAAFLGARDLLTRFPRAGPRTASRNRRKRISGFRYDIVYRLRRGDIYVLAIAHHSRKPNYWRRRLR